MNKELVSIHLARKAFEKGFDESTHDYFWTDKATIASMRSSKDYYKLHSQQHYRSQYINEEHLYTISVPTQSQLQRWLRDVHNIYVIVTPNKSEYEFECDNLWTMTVYKNTTDDKENYVKIFEYIDHEQALEDGLKIGLDLI